jgi:beta-glucosidase
MCNRAIKSGIAFDKEEELDTNEKVKALLKEASLAATVLIKNENNILPLNEKKIKKLAVIGGNARDAYPSGGGSASMRLAYAVDPLSAIREAVKGSKMEVEFAVGAFSARYLPLLDRYVKNGKGEQGRYDFAFYAQNPEDSSAKPVHTLTLDTSVNFMVCLHR